MDEGKFWLTLSKNFKKRPQRDLIWREKPSEWNNHIFLVPGILIVCCCAYWRGEKSEQIKALRAETLSSRGRKCDREMWRYWNKLSNYTKSSFKVHQVRFKEFLITNLMFFDPTEAWFGNMMGDYEGIWQKTFSDDKLQLFFFCLLSQIWCCSVFVLVQAARPQLSPQSHIYGKIRR